ncbi:MAG: ferredoxin [Candidatus Nanoarchaeia archaeon]|nr:ferredoxin [Candidatus Nanoarchaeia archaeon]
MAKYKIKIDEKKCIGCGACASVCSEIFELKEKNNEYKATLKKKESDLPCVKEAAEVCPVQCIHLS